jgi:hypothetical protein
MENNNVTRKLKTSTWKIITLHGNYGREHWKKNYGSAKLVVNSSGRFNLASIASTDLVNVASNLIGPFVLYWEKVENIVWISSLFWSFILLKEILPSDPIDDFRYSTLVTVLSSFGSLQQRFISSSCCLYCLFLLFVMNSGEQS